MKVLIKFTQTGKYKDQAWDPLKIKFKGDISAVTPSYAAQLIEKERATLVTSEEQHIFIEA